MPSTFGRLLLPGVSVALTSSVCVASAAVDCLGSPRWKLGGIAGHGVRSDLVEIVPRAASGSLRRADSSLRGMVVRRTLEHERSFAGACWSIDASLAWHGGATSHREAVLALRPEWPLARIGNVKVLAAWGLGWSQSFGKPWSDYEHPDRPEGYQALLHMSPEIGLRWRGRKDWEVGVRVHHRSGVYGIVAPGKVGANYLSVLVLRQL
jgi:hypothetical protein